jgi:hypothetical protein
MSEDAVEASEVSTCDLVDTMDEAAVERRMLLSRASGKKL